MFKNFNSLFFMSRRAYGATAENVKLRPTTAMMSKVVVEAVETSNSPAKQVFWMRDPKTGNWIPENHFGELDDAADLRDKLLPKKPTS